MARAYGISGAGAFFASRHTNTLGNPTTWGTSGNGLDVKMWGGTASNYLLWDSSENKLVLSGAYAKMSIAAQANTAGSGVKISATYPGALRVFSDDGGANIGDSVRGVQSRFLLTVDQSGGSIRSLQGQLKMATGVDVTTGIYTAVQGYVEMAGTHVAKTGSTFSCIDASAEIGTSLTIDSGGEFFGIHVETTGSGTITNNGTAAAIGITKASGAADWPVGLFIDRAVIRGIQSGGAYSSTVNLATPIANATWLNGFFSDDAGVDQAAGVRRNVIARTLFTVDQTTAANDYDVIRGHLKAASGVDFGGDTSTKACVRGYFEMAGATVCGSGSFMSALMGEFWADGNITGTGKAAGVMSRIYTSTGTVSGTTAAFMATKHFASTQNWPYGLYIDSATVDIRLSGGPTIRSGTGDPNGSLAGTKGSIYLRADNSSHDDTVYCNTDGGTTWAAIVSA